MADLPTCLLPPRNVTLTSPDCWYMGLKMDSPVSLSTRSLSLLLL